MIAILYLIGTNWNPQLNTKLYKLRKILMFLQYVFQLYLFLWGIAKQSLLTGFVMELFAGSGWNGLGTGDSWRSDSEQTALYDDGSNSSVFCATIVPLALLIDLVSLLSLAAAVCVSIVQSIGFLFTATFRAIANLDKIYSTLS